MNRGVCSSRSSRARAVARARAYATRAMPEALDKIQHFNGPGELFDQFNIEAELEALLARRDVFQGSIGCRR